MDNSDSNFATQPPQREPQLSADDQRLVDALMDSGFDRNVLSAVSREDSKRLDAICGVLGLLRDYPVEDADETLVHATLARIDRHEDAHAARMKFDTVREGVERARGGWRIRVPDFITVAAVLLIAVSIFWPVLNNARQESLKNLCQSNMQHMAYAFGQYAADNNMQLPMAMAGIGESVLSWDKYSNILNMEPLVRGHYCDAKCLNCPGHYDHANAAGPSYSYRWITPGVQLGWGTGRVSVIVGDLNPMVDASRSGQFLPPLSISPNHGGRGQNVLVSDGSNLWLEHPIVSGDNIWLRRGSDRLRPGDQPADASDVMLTQ